ncbi:MAG TPA: UDP-N-acetylmuramate dehydrogenase [Armatimonadota bacterium]|nr:UDP-N-acetylmuramate dehydrogenase [Armatimonadota bacterium]
MPPPSSLVSPQLLQRLRRELATTDILPDEPMSRHTSFHIGGPADVLLLPHTVADLQRIAALAREAGVPFTVIGNGSNLLVRDGGLRGIVLKVAENLARVEIDGTHCRAQSGSLLALVSRTVALRGLGGMEFAVGIPGTTGGGVMMNAGAYGGEMKDVVTGVTVVDETGCLRALTAEELQFGYRRSLLQSREWIVGEIAMELRPDDPERILARMSYNQYLREDKQPLAFPSAGSVFKRPPGKYVGPMIEQLGLKGYRIGGAQVSEKHAGFIINQGGARAADVLALIQHVREQVQARFDVWLETEVRVIGEDLGAGGVTTA